MLSSSSLSFLNPQKRKKTFDALRKRYPRKHVFPFFDVFASQQPMNPVKLWGSEVDEPQDLLTDGITVGEQLTVRTSVSNPEVYTATIKDNKLMTLADYRDRAVLKGISSQAYPDTLDTFTTDVAMNMLLNRLVTEFDKTVTPHFVTLLDAFHGRPLSGSSESTSMYWSIAERGDMTLSDFLEATASQDTTSPFRATPDIIRSLLFQITHAAEAAYRLYSFSHNDLTDDNIMIRTVDHTQYNNVAWAYKREVESDYYFIPLEMHGNIFCEIIDFGHSSLMGFNEDDRTFPTETLQMTFFLVWNRLNRLKGVPDWDKLFAEIKSIPFSDGTVSWTDWPVFESIKNTSRVFDPEHNNAMLVGLQPDDSIARQEMQTIVDEMNTASHRLMMTNFPLLQQRMQASIRCGTCNSSKVTLQTVNTSHAFCGRHCAQVYFNVINS